MAFHSSSSLRATTCSRSTVIRGRFRVSCTNIKATKHQATTDLNASLSRSGDSTSYPGAVASRRHALQASLSVAAVAFTQSGWLWQTPPALAVEGLLAEEMQSVEELPKEFEKVVRLITVNVRASLEAEANGATEGEVRRKADPAKGGFQEFIRDWVDDGRVIGTVPHTEIKAALQELSAFYKAQGSRTRLPMDMRNSILGRLTRAEGAFPPEPERPKLLGLF